MHVDAEKPGGRDSPRFFRAPFVVSETSVHRLPYDDRLRLRRAISVTVVVFPYDGEIPSIAICQRIHSRPDDSSLAVVHRGRIARDLKAFPATDIAVDHGQLSDRGDRRRIILNGYGLRL